MNEAQISGPAAQAAAGFQERAEAVQAFILHHLADQSALRLPYLHLPLPNFVSLHGLMVVLAALLAVLVLVRGRPRRDGAPRGLANLLEFFVVFVRDSMVRPYFGEEDGRRMTPLFCSFFVFVLLMNLVGLVPCGYTATANISVTGALAAVTLGFMILGAMFRHGPVGFLKGFMPPGVPWPVLLLLVPVELAGLVVKAFALTIRLFANELAGHLVLLFILGLVVILGAKALPFVLLGVMIYILEVAVAFLQAYIFTLLSAIFIGQRYHPEH